NFDRARLVRVLDADEHASTVRQLDAGGELALDERLAESFADAHHLAGRLHLRSENRVDARKFDKREHGFLHREIRWHDFAGNTLRLEGLSHHAARSDLGERTTGRF